MGLITHQRADVSDVLTLLDLACATVDDLWLSALRDDSAAAVDLGEASMAIHRALLALTPDSG
jgi:hypothetical protein